MKRLKIILGCILTLTAIGAIPAGLMFLLDTSGGLMGMDKLLLANSPFTTFLVPGLFLLFINGLGSAAGAYISFTSGRLAGWFGCCLGIILIIWIMFQVYWIGLTSFLQPLFAVTGMLETVIGLVIIRNSRAS